MMVRAGTALLFVGLVAGEMAAQSEDTALEPAQLRKMLTDMGYEPNDLGSGVNEITIDRDEWKVFILLQIDKDQSMIWLESRFSPIPDLDQVPVEALLNLLEANERIGPAHFAYRQSDQRIHLYKPISNQGITPAVMRKRINEFDSLVRRTEHLWNSANFQSSTDLRSPPTRAVSGEEPRPHPLARAKARLRGTWRVMGIEMNGTVVDQEDIVVSRMTLTFTDQELIIRRRDADDDVTTFTVKVGKDYNQIDITNQDNEIEKGIYRIDGDRMVLVFADAGKPRPTSFTPGTNLNGGVMIMRRDPDAFKE